MKLSRRERALIQHAIHRDRATMRLSVFVGKHELMNLSVVELMAWNVIHGRPKAFALYYASGSRIMLDEWREPPIDFQI